MSCSISPDASYITARGEGGRAAAIGPAWRSRNGQWHSLAACSDAGTWSQKDARVWWNTSSHRFSEEPPPGPGAPATRTVVARADL